jgi:hypothetical protein
MKTENNIDQEPQDRSLEHGIGAAIQLSPYLALVALIGAGVVSGVKSLVKEEKRYERNRVAHLVEINENKPALVAGKTYDVVDDSYTSPFSNGYMTGIVSMPLGSTTHYYLKLRQQQLHNGRKTTVTELEPVDEHLYFNTNKGTNVIYSQLLKQEEQYQESHHK